MENFVLASVFWETDTGFMNLFHAIVPLPQMVFSFWLLRKRFWQALFLHSINFLHNTLTFGIGMYASETWFAHWARPLLGASAVNIAMAILTPPPLLYLLRRFCESPGMRNSNVWKVIWLLPLLFFVMTLISGRSFLFVEVELDGFLTMRVISFFLMLFTFYILDSTSRQTVELVRLNETARHAGRLLDIQRGRPPCGGG